MKAVEQIAAELSTAKFEIEVIAAPITGNRRTVTMRIVGDWRGKHTETGTVDQASPNDLARIVGDYVATAMALGRW